MPTPLQRRAFPWLAAGLLLAGLVWLFHSSRFALRAGSDSDVFRQWTCARYVQAGLDPYRIGRDILRANTFGTGEMIRHAVEQEQVRSIILGLGGSATNDGGAGMAAALGVRFLDSNGRPLEPSPGAWTGRLARVDGSRRMPLPPLTAACDVTSPLLGPCGATRVFGPQKGARDADIPILEAALQEMMIASGGETAAVRPGAGAAGGLGFGLLHFTGANLLPGFELLAGLTNLSGRVAEADLVVTGEGSLDVQTLAGKAPAGVARLARAQGKPVWVFCGRADRAARDSATFDEVVDLAASGLPLETLMADAARLLEEAASKTGLNKQSQKRK